MAAVMISASAAVRAPASLQRLRAPVAAPAHRSLASLPVAALPARGGFRAALGGARPLRHQRRPERRPLRLGLRGPLQRGEP
jgi:hypothetical protein